MLNECDLKNFIEWMIQHYDKNKSDKVLSFRGLVGYLRNKCRSTIVEYKQDINDVMKKAEDKLELGNGKNRKRCYGVYIIYRVYSTEKECEDLVKRGCGEVLYIGMSGTIVSDAHHTDVCYRKQDVIERIGNTKSGGKSNNKNTKSKYIASNEWFKEINQNHGRICIEIICIDVVDKNNRKPQCKLLTPAFIEKLLLSCYLCERGKLPRRNSEL